MKIKELFKQVVAIINELYLKIKLYYKELLFTAIFVLANFVSFQLGAQSAFDKGEIRLYKGELSEAKLHSAKNSFKFFVASKHGKYYYFIACKGAGRIKDANKVYFKSEKAAQAAGYKPAKSCMKE